MKYNTIKKISFAALLVLFLVTMLGSCEADVVELSPVDVLSDETVYSSAERCEMAIIGVYDAAQSGYYKGNDARRGYPFGSASIIQSDMRGADMMNMESFFLITYNNTISMTSANNVSMWENSFNAVNRANVVMEGIESARESGVLTSEQADQYIGECLFIRGLVYSNLMIHFCLPYGVAGNSNYGLPYYEKAINSAESTDEALQIDRSTVEATYAKIFTDLNKAEQLLPDVNPVNKITRASKGAAIAIKTRLNLWKKDWKGVITEAKKMVPSTEMPFLSPIGGYKLEGSPDTPFTSFTANSESIFSCENSSDDNSTVNGSIGQMMSTRDGGRALIAMSPILYNSTWWLENDLRRETLTTKAKTGFVFSDKYQRPVDQDEYAPIIRYAEVLLNYAEAAVRDGNVPLALELLNAVRNRSVEEADYYTVAKFPTSKALLEAILWERRIEFFGEGRRWEDIHRLINDTQFPTTGIPAKTAPKKIKAANFGFGVLVPEPVPTNDPFYLTSPIPFTDRRFLWPIPQDDIIRNPTIAKQQNAGW